MNYTKEDLKRAYHAGWYLPGEFEYKEELDRFIDKIEREKTIELLISMIQSVLHQELELSTLTIEHGKDCDENTFYAYGTVEDYYGDEIAYVISRDFLKTSWYNKEEEAMNSICQTTTSNPQSYYPDVLKIIQKLNIKIDG